MNSPSMISRPVAAALAVLGVTSPACQGPLEIRYETEHLRVGTSFEEPLCRGYLDHLELVVTTAEQTLGTDLESPVNVYLWSDQDWVSSEWCDTAKLGCFSNNSTYGTTFSVDHELVHAVIDTIGQPAPFWEEGTAEGFQRERVSFADTAPVSNLELDIPELSYDASAMFARWLFETYGPDKYRALLRHPGEAREALESVYGVTAEEAQEEYFSSAPHSYGAMVTCEHAELAAAGEREWLETIDLDCDHKHVWGGPYGMAAFRVLDISERGHYQVLTQAESFLIGRCKDETLDYLPLEGDPAEGDIPPITAAMPDQFVRWFPGGEEPILLELVPGRYEVSIGQGDFEPRTYELSVRLAPGPVPTTPG